MNVRLKKRKERNKMFIREEIQRYTLETTQITNIYVDFLCTKCGHTWRIKLSDEKEIKSQAGRFICMPCYQEALGSATKDTYYDHRNPKTDLSK